ncbi:MAG: hypothetical protein JWQ75_562 [Pseudarthrobacter sp.]|nr:hypothetical protein [Pseudarthrobacter sp.]
MGTQKINTAKLEAGDYIEAWHNGKLFHQGRVTDVVPRLDLFWILDARTGTRRLLDPEVLEIIKVADKPTDAGPPRIHPAGATA